MEYAWREAEIVYDIIILVVVKLYIGCEESPTCVIIILFLVNRMMILLYSILQLKIQEVMVFPINGVC